MQHQVQDRPLFLASTFLDLPYPEHGWFTCINDILRLNAATIAGRPFDQVMSWLKSSTTTPAILKRTNPLHQKLKPWEKLEEVQFCHPNLPEDAPASEKKQKPKRKFPAWNTKPETDGKPPSSPGSPPTPKDTPPAPPLGGQGSPGHRNDNGIEH